MHRSELGIPPVQVLSVEDISQLPVSLIRKQKYFTLLLAWDLSDPNDPQMHDVFRRLVSQGLAYFCAWGLNCEAAHDAVDKAKHELAVGLGDEDHLCVTTWHSDESLDEAACFFANLAIPSEQFVLSSFERFAVAAGNSTWGTTLQNLK